MIIHPALNENNYSERIGLGNEDCYIDSLTPLQDLKIAWRQTETMTYKANLRGVEIERVLPSREAGMERFTKYGLPTGNIPFAPMINKRLRFMWNTSKILSATVLIIPY